MIQKINRNEKETQRKSNRQQKHKSNIITKPLPKLETKNTCICIHIQNHNWKFNMTKKKGKNETWEYCREYKGIKKMI